MGLLRYLHEKAEERRQRETQRLIDAFEKDMAAFVLDSHTAAFGILNDELDREELEKIVEKHTQNGLSRWQAVQHARQYCSELYGAATSEEYHPIRTLLLFCKKDGRDKTILRRLELAEEMKAY
jgi:hypothetical protein